MWALSSAANETFPSITWNGWPRRWGGSFGIYYPRWTGSRCSHSIAPMLSNNALPVRGSEPTPLRPLLPRSLRLAQLDTSSRVPTRLRSLPAALVRQGPWPSAGRLSVGQVLLRSSGSPHYPKGLSLMPKVILALSAKVTHSRPGLFG